MAIYFELSKPKQKELVAKARMQRMQKNGKTQKDHYYSTMLANAQREIQEVVRNVFNEYTKK